MYSVSVLDGIHSLSWLENYVFMIIGSLSALVFLFYNFVS